MYAGIAMTTFIALCVLLARLVRDLLLVRLIRALATDDTLSPGQRFQICARLVSALAAGTAPPDHRPAAPDDRDQRLPPLSGRRTP